MRIANHCAFGSHIGMTDEILYGNVADMDPNKSAGYLSTLLIRKSAGKMRRATGG